MFIENLKSKSKEEMIEYLNNLSDSDKTALFTEIEQNKKKAEEEYIRLETTKSKLDEDEKEVMDKIKAIGINSYEELESEIKKLEDIINSEIVKYVEALKEE